MSFPQKTVTEVNQKRIFWPFVPFQTMLSANIYIYCSCLTKWDIIDKERIFVNIVFVAKNFK